MLLALRRKMESAFCLTPPSLGVPAAIGFAGRIAIRPYGAAGGGWAIIRYVVLHILRSSLRLWLRQSSLAHPVLRLLVGF